MNVRNKFHFGNIIFIYLMIITSSSFLMGNCYDNTMMIELKQTTRLLLQSINDDLSKQQKQTNRMAEYPGDIMLGAVFPIHQHDTTNYSCGILQV